MGVTLFHLLIFLSLLIQNTSGSLLTVILDKLEAHREIFYLAESEDSTFDASSSKFMYSTYYNTTSSHKNQNFSIVAGIMSIFKFTGDIVIIIDMESNRSAFDVLQSIGNASTSLRELRRISTFVMWPYSVKNETEVKALRDSQEYKLATANFLVNSQLFFVFGFMPGERVMLYEAYRAGDYTALKLLEQGYVQWNCTFCEGLSLRRFNFHKRVLKVTAVNDTDVNDDIHVFEDSDGNISYGRGGFSGTMLEILQHLLNFTSEPMLAKEFGSQIPGTNHWTGSIGDIAEGMADLAISVTVFQPNRAQVVSFLPPADEHLINAFFITPDQNSIRDIFAQPFKGELWIAVLTTWLVLALCMIGFTRVRKKYGIEEEEDILYEDDKPEPDFAKDSFIWALSTVCQQGWDDHPKAFSLRAIFISGSFTGVVAYAGYSAAIVSTLSLRIEPIQNPTQLLHSNLEVGIRRGFISNLLEQNKTMDTMSHFYKKVERSPQSLRYLNISSGLDRLLHHSYAFITTRDTIYDYLKMTTDDKVICGIKDMPILKYGFPLGYPIPKFSPYREILRYAMTMIREPGILYRLRLKYAFERRCLEVSSNTGYALGPNDVFTAYMILCGGSALSLTFLLAERVTSGIIGRYTYIR